MNIPYRIMEQQNNFSEDNNFNLPSLLSDDTLSLSEISEKVLYMKKKQEIERKYKERIKTRKDGRQYYIYISRKQYTSTSYERLLSVLYELEYGRATSSLADLYPEWMIWRRDCSPVCDKTLKENSHCWNSYLKDNSISQIPLVDLTPKDFIRVFRQWTKDRQLTRKKFNNIKSLINGIYYYAIEEGIVTHNPVKDISSRNFTFKAVNHSDDVFTLDERKKLLAHLTGNDDMYSLAIQLDFQLVARIGELLSLRWSDIEGNNLHIQSQLITERKMNDDLTFSKREHVNVDHVKGNTDHGFRYQPLTAEALRLLEKIREQNPNGEFILMKDGRQLNANSFNRWLKRYCEECDVPVRSSHKIRFCTASILYSNGMDLPTLQRLLGHSTAAMSMHYLRRVTPTTDTAAIMTSALS